MNSQSAITMFSTIDQIKSMRWAGASGLVGGPLGRDESFRLAAVDYRQGDDGEWNFEFVWKSVSRDVID